MTINNADGTVTVKFLDSNSKKMYQVVMFKLPAIWAVGDVYAYFIIALLIWGHSFLSR